MNVIITTVAIGGHYPRAAARLIERFNAVSPGYQIQAWVNTLPPGAPKDVIVDGYDYTAYCAKPFALEYARKCGATQAILLDASFFPIRPIMPMVEHIQRAGYYLCKNDFKVGEWSSDDCLRRMDVTREEAFRMEEISSYCVGVDFTQEWHKGREMLEDWMDAARQGAFPGPHTATGHPGRNPGFVSTDARVKGHRHDQTALSIIANRLGMDRLSTRPDLTAYHLGYGGAFPNASTVLVNHGVIDGWTEGKDVR